MRTFTAEPKLHIGIDIHKASWKVNIYTDLSSSKTFTMPPRAEKLEDHINTHFPTAKEIN